MAFSESIKLMVDVVTGNSRSALSNLKSDLNDADGAFNKVKVAGSASFDFIKQNAAGFALGAGTALVGFAAQSVAAFQDTALGAGRLRDSLGVTSEEASRLQEVAGDLGIPIGALETSIGRMNRTAATTPGLFAEIGAEIVKNRDGTVNTTETYLNVIDALNRIPDPTQRAAAAQKILGKSWMESSELIAIGAQGVRDAMASVEEGKIIDDDEVASARAFRDQLDELKGAAESFALSVGSELVPVLTDAAEAIESLTGPLTKVKNLYEDVVDTPVIKQLYENLAPWEQWRTRVDQVKTALGDASEEMTFTYNAAESLALASENLAATTDLVNDALMGAAEGAESGGQGYQMMANAALTGAAASDGLTKAQDAARESVQELADALNTQIDAMFGAADATIAADNAQREFAEAAAETNRITREGEDAAGDLDAAVRAERDAMIEAANAAVELGAEQARASGTTQTASSRVDAFNSSLLANASYATPAARNAITSYILEANRIPPEKATEIRALIEQGRIAEAERLINQTSRTRTAAINADANTASAEQQLNYAARGRNALISAVFGAGVPRAGGGTVGIGEGTTLVGERGPELVHLAPGSHVNRESETRSALRGSNVGGGGGDTYNIYGTDKNEVMAELRRQRFAKAAVPVAGARR